jgi:hypothetical protein
LRLAGLESAAMPLSRTSKVCAPSPTLAYSAGEEQATQVPPSMRQVNAASSVSPLAAKLKLALWSLTVPDGPPVITAWGAWAATAVTGSANAPTISDVSSPLRISACAC